jgi:hypothetical protein
MKDYTSPQVGKEIQKMLNTPQNKSNIRRVWNKLKMNFKRHMSKSDFKAFNKLYSK